MAQSKSEFLEHLCAALVCLMLIYSFLSIPYRDLFGQPIPNHPYTSTPSVLLATLASYLSLPFTVIDVLYRVKFDTKYIGDKFVLYVLGAEKDLGLMSIFLILQEILYRRPSFNELVVIAIDPLLDEVHNGETIVSNYGTGLSVAKVTYIKHRRVRLMMHLVQPLTIHFRTFCEPDNSNVDPTLIIVHDQLLIGQHSSTLHSILSRAFLCIATSHNRNEAYLDMLRLKSLEARVLWAEGRNRFTGPKLRGVSEDGSPRYQNAFTLAFQGTL